MEVLTAYVRQHAHWRPAESKPTEGSSPAADIQAIMTVIRRRTRSFLDGEPERLDLHGTNLARADLSGANLSGANLSGAKLSNATLYVANLPYATLLKAKLSYATLSYATLYVADLSSADLYVADLSYAKLSEANLRGAHLSGANLSKANLSEAKHLTQEKLEQTTGDGNTQLPPDLEPPAHWIVKTDEQIEGD
jgi:uncharacterized protein YjbI with pentapeptide repeats